MLTLVLSALPLSAGDSLSDLRKRADAAHGSNCASLCLQAAQALVEESHELFGKGDAAAAQLSVKDAMDYARRGTDASLASKKRRKETEIALRKLEKRLNDMARTLEIDQRAPLHADISAIENLRAKLLSSMFELRPE